MWHSTPSLGVTKYVDQNSVLKLGSQEIKFYHVPGHTEDSMLIVTSEHVFTGDFLFTGEGGVGRDDLPSGRLKAHWDSLQVMSNLSGDLLVCTGHEAPGVEMQTLSWNNEHNPVLKMTNYKDYVKWQEDTVSQLGHVSKIKVHYLQIFLLKFLMKSLGYDQFIGFLGILPLFLLVGKCLQIGKC